MTIEVKLTMCIIYGIVVIRCIRLPTSYLYNVRLNIETLSSLLNFVPMEIGVFFNLHFLILKISKIYLTYLFFKIKIPYSYFSTMILRIFHETKISHFKFLIHCDFKFGISYMHRIIHIRSNN